MPFAASVALTSDPSSRATIAVTSIASVSSTTTETAVLGAAHRLEPRRATWTVFVAAAAPDKAISAGTVSSFATTTPTVAPRDTRTLASPSGTRTSSDRTSASTVMPAPRTA